MKVTGVLRRTRGLVALFAAVATAGALYLWQGQAGAAERPAPVFTAVQLSDAVLFNEGPAAPYLAALGRGEVAWSENLRAGQSAVREAISRDQKFATSFAARLQSGDPVRVEGALRDLSGLAREALNERLGQDVVDEAVKRLIVTLASAKVLDIIGGDGVIPFNLPRPLTYPCCLEDYFDPVTSSVVVAFLERVWGVSGDAAKATGMIQEIMIGTVARELQADVGAAR